MSLTKITVPGVSHPMHFAVGEVNRLGMEGLIAHLTNDGLLFRLILVFLENVFSDLPLTSKGKLFVTMRALERRTEINPSLLSRTCHGFDLFLAPSNPLQDR